MFFNNVNYKLRIIIISERNAVTVVEKEYNTHNKVMIR